jgi:hypothetical protein
MKTTVSRKRTLRILCPRREKSERPVHLTVLRDLVGAVLEDESSVHLTKCVQSCISSKGTLDMLSSNSFRQLAELLGRITSTVKTQAPLWELYAVFNARTGVLTRCARSMYMLMLSQEGPIRRWIANSRSSAR